MSPEEYDSLLTNLRKLPGEFKALIEKRIELFTLETGERIAGLIAHAIYRIFGIVFLALGLIMVLFAAANYIGNLLDSRGLGFIIVAAPMLLLGIMFFLRRPRSMVIAVRNKMLNQFLQDMSDQLSQFENDNNTGNANPGPANPGPANPDPANPDKQNSSESQKPNH